MKTTKVYSITIPPGLAKKENRTMSELMREAMRKYQQPEVMIDVRELVRQIAPPRRHCSPCRKTPGSIAQTS